MSGDSDRARMQLFDLETMSGVTPGIRTQIMQRVYLRGNTPGIQPVWARLLWYEEPDSTVQATTVEGATCFLQRQAERGANRWQPDPLLTIENVTSVTLNRTLQSALSADELTPYCCGACTMWRATGTRTEDGLPLGLCTVAPTEPADLHVPDVLSRQALLAPGCRHWQPVDQPVSDDPRRGEAAGQELPRAAVLTKEREASERGFRARLRRALRSSRRPASRAQTLDDWQARLEERSGVGAGTEPCFACQGRIANLGALTVATDEDDKHTYSVWRCRVCRALYLNSWIDRWERLDNLETEETYYRLAPAQAVEALAVIDRAIGGEHPAGRRERGAQRAWFERFTTGLPMLSHQRKQGR